MRGNRVAQLGVDFLEDILQGRRHSHPRLHGKTQSMGLALAVIGVLAKNHHLDLLQRRVGKGVEDVLAGGKDPLAGGFSARRNSRNLRI